MNENRCGGLIERWTVGVFIAIKWSISGVSDTTSTTIRFSEI